jgi:hypothetical protein
MAGNLPHGESKKRVLSTRFRSFQNGIGLAGVPAFHETVFLCIVHQLDAAV